MIKLLTFDNSLTHYDILVKRRSRMTTAITFSPGGGGGGGGGWEIFIFFAAVYEGKVKGLAK